MKSSDGVVLSLGSNLGDRLQNLKSAVELLGMKGLTEIQVSPVVETAAWLKPGSPREWNRPYLNLVLKAQSHLLATEGLRVCQEIEQKLGRQTNAVWSPRPIDIDLILWNGERMQSPELNLPHAGAFERPFVLDPWMALSPEQILRDSKSVLQFRRQLADPCPVLMGVVNITPDSFSDGGVNFSDESLREYFESIASSPPSIIDLGGQSTRPGATMISETEEWNRLNRALTQVEALHEGRVRPWISIDTTRAELARRAIEWGVEIINDVSGFEDPMMLELAASTQAQFVFMHHLGVPVNRAITLPVSSDPVAEVMRWADNKLNLFIKAGVAIERLIFDPGIGFGKTPEQSLTLIDRVSELKKLPVRVLIGHSRKSYQAKATATFTERYSHLDPNDRDAVTVQQSLEMTVNGVEFLRVHNVLAHRKAFLQFFSQENRK